MIGDGITARAVLRRFTEDESQVSLGVLIPRTLHFLRAWVATNPVEELRSTLARSMLWPRRELPSNVWGG